MKKLKFQSASKTEVHPAVLRYGLTEIHTPMPSSAAEVDIVLVHGLNGDPKLTWTSKSNGVFWPKDLLPPYIDESNARLLVWGYDADIVSFAAKDTGVTKDKIHNHAERLVADLYANRRIRKAAERPILFIAHSLGGLIVKRAIIYSTEINGVKTEHLRSVAVSTYGIFFLGTPHKGSNLGQWASYLEWLCKAMMPKKILDSQPYLVEALKTNSETLQIIDRQFSMIMDKYHLFFFHEAKPTSLKGTSRFIVEEESAAPILPDVERASIQADHSSMCKFENDNSPGFDLIVDGIQRYAEEAPPMIKQRWVAEKQERLNQKLRKAKELVPGAIDDARLSANMLNEQPSSTVSPSNSILGLRDSSIMKQVSATSSTDFLSVVSKPTEPFFIVPPGFRPNPVFIGMQRELRLLDQHLFDERRDLGTSSVLIHGQPGGGKSHVVRQYVHENRQRFPGGIFWINAHLIGEVENDFWQIVQKVIAKVSPELMLSIQDPGHRYADTVREWFESRQEWLIVLDGIAIEKENDLETIQGFVPNSPHSSIVYISRSRRFEAIDGLLNPVAVKVRPLSESEGCSLLFKELRMDLPRPAQIKSATDLVNKIGGLPLAIDAIAKRIADTHVPIEKYSMKSYSTDPILGGTYRVVMDDLRKNRHREALNLISIICFFGPHIPVEMIHLGIRALKIASVDVASSESGEEADLNTTLGILMRHSLVERNEPDDTSSLSGSRDSLVEPEPIDMLKMHTVIQRFCMDSLNASKRLPIWLNHACQLFICSYHEADTRIRSRPEPGRVSDYRQYSIHGEQLRQHTLGYDSKRQSLSHIRSQLDATLKDVLERIRILEPRSSQESVFQTEFQSSIFDRTNTSSSSNNSQSDERSRSNSSPGQAVSENELADPASRRESGSTIKSKKAQSTRPPLMGAELLPYTSVSTGGEHLPISRPMQKSNSDTPTLCPHDNTLISSSGIRRGSSAPIATLNVDSAAGTNFAFPPSSKQNERPPLNALTSLTTVHNSEEPSPKESGPFWAWPHSHRNVSIPSGSTSNLRGALATDVIGSQHAIRDASAPAESAFQPPVHSSPPIDVGTTIAYIDQVQLGAQTPLRSELVLPKSPLATPLMSPFYDAKYWENVVSVHTHTSDIDVSKSVPPPLHSSARAEHRMPHQYAGPPEMNAGYPTSNPTLAPRASVSGASMQVSLPAHEAVEFRSDCEPTASTTQSVSARLSASTSDINLLQAAMTQESPEKVLQLGASPPKSQSPRAHAPTQSGNVRPGGSPFFKLFGDSPGQQSHQFTSTNSSPAVPHHMFSSIYSDVNPSGLLAEPERSGQPRMTAIVTTAPEWTEMPAQDRRPQVQSAPPLQSEFPPNPSMASSSQRTTSANAGVPPNSPVIPIASGSGIQGLGIAKLPEQIPITSLTVVPPSDPRRRLRAREGRLTERDVNILVRQPSEDDHPLAPKEDPMTKAADPNTAVLTLNAADGRTIFARTDLRDWKPLSRNVGARSSAPYPEASRIATDRESASVHARMADREPENKRRRSAPESPGWNAIREGEGWLGRR